MVLATSQQEFSDADFRIVDNADQSKKLALQVSGLTTATTRTLTAPDASGTIMLTSDLATGTFTPTFVSSGATFSYAVNSGRYAKVGTRVLFTMHIGLNTTGNTLTANPLTLAGLPFTSANNSILSMAKVHWFASTSSYVDMSLEIDQNATTATFRGITAAATSSFAAVNSNAALHATNGSAMRISGFYETP